MSTFVKEMIESAIHSLTNGDTISNIMLKAQAIAYSLKNEEFKKWIKLEQRGYGDDDNISEYRKIPCGVIVKVAIPFFIGEREIPIPPYSIPNDEINKRLYFIVMKQPLTEIESLIKIKENHIFHMKIPASLFPSFKPILRPDVSIQDAWQYAEKSSLESIIDNVKSRLLEFFQELDNNIDFTSLDNTQKINNIMSQTINAGIINTNGAHTNIDINNSSIIGENQNTITINRELKNQIEEILRQIEEIKSNVNAEDTDITQYIFEIRQELQKEKPSGKFIKKSLKALKSFGAIVVSKTIECGLDKLISLIPC